MCSLTFGVVPKFQHMNDDIRKFIKTDRRDFKGDPFDINTADPDPIKQFSTWFEQLLELATLDAYAFVLATSGVGNMPSGRVLYMRDLSNRGLTFYTNYYSDKGRELDANPQASCVFFWPALNRQVRIAGRTEKLTSAESDEYFNSRPRESRIGAWASEQSTVLKDREVLVKRVEEFTQKFADIEVPRPPHWGGYLLIPETFEFWQGRESRLHDRLLYSKDSSSHWSIDRLSP